MNYNIATILAVIAILFVLITYITSAPLVPVAVILSRAGDYFRGKRKRKFEKQLSAPTGQRLNRRAAPCRGHASEVVELLANVFLISLG